jgi:hypothetical protein
LSNSAQHATQISKHQIESQGDHQLEENIMRALPIAILFTITTSCIDSGSEKGGESLSIPQQPGSYTIGSSTIERHSINSDTIELYTPGAHEIGLYDPATGQVSTTPANRTMSAGSSRPVTMPAAPQPSTLSLASAHRRTT